MRKSFPIARPYTTEDAARARSPCFPETVVTVGAMCDFLSG
jgi:hypothetical protein